MSPRKSYYAKNETVNQDDFRGLAAKAITNIVLQFGDNRPKRREVTGGEFEKF